MKIDLLRQDPWNENSGITYYGYAFPGSSETDWVWTIKRKRIVNGVFIYEYPFITGMTSSNSNPSIFVSNVVGINMTALRWDFRASYVYSKTLPKNLINSGIWDDNKIWLDSDIWVDFP